MPAEQINFRYDVPEATEVQLAYRLKKDGWLTDGFMHFPLGCNALVQVRMLLEIGGVLKLITPIENEFIALDDANYPFLIDRGISRLDRIIVEIRNTDEDNEHQISVIITWSSERVVAGAPVAVEAVPVRRIR